MGIHFSLVSSVKIVKIVKLIFPTAVTVGFIWVWEWCEVFAEPKNWNGTATLKSWNLLLGCKAGLI